MSRVVHAQNPNTPYSEDLEMVAVGLCHTVTTVAYTEEARRPDGSVSPAINCKRCLALLDKHTPINLVGDYDANVPEGQIDVAVSSNHCGVSAKQDAILTVIRNALIDAGYRVA